MQKDQQETGIIISPEKLSPQALDGLVEEFILREGTDYGNRVFTAEEKKEHVFKQIKSKRVVVVYDANADACSLLPKDHEALKNFS